MIMSIRVADIAFHLRQYLGKASRVAFPKPTPDGSVVRLHLGCGGIDHPGFINIDGIDRPHVHFVQSLSKLSRFRDFSVAFVYTSHTLEHFPRSETLPILKEWHRVLVKDGKLCLSVPDFARILQIYQIGGNDVDAILPPLFGGQDYPFNFHHTCFDQQSLTHLLKEAGFSKVESWTPGSDAFHNLPDWSGRSLTIQGQRIPISLNLEATK
jgi:predicted SAM-dependent methyltransferase